MGQSAPAEAREGQSGAGHVEPNLGEVPALFTAEEETERVGTVGEGARWVWSLVWWGHREAPTMGRGPTGIKS